MFIVRIAAAVLLSLLTVFLCAGTVSASCMNGESFPRGGLEWPTKGEVIKGWSLSCATDRGHRGIDINTPEGSVIEAAADGTVTFCGFTPAEGGGATVSIEHSGGIKTTYMHLSGIKVAKGDTVQQGQTIGQSDGTPLHFGIKSSHGNRYADPLSILPPPATLTDMTDDDLSIVAVVPEQESTSMPEAAMVPADGSFAVTQPAADIYSSSMPGSAIADGATYSVTAVDIPATGIAAEQRHAEVTAPEEVPAATDRPATITGQGDVTKPVLNPAGGLVLRGPSTSAPGILLGQDGIVVPAWNGWLGNYIQRSAALGLLVSTMVLAAVRRLIWREPEGGKINSGSTQGNKFAGPGPLHGAAA